MSVAARNVPQRLGRYEVVGQLAIGGMAEILLGRMTGPSGFERPVVIKRVLPALLQHGAFVDMFLDEARIAAGIRHPNVVHVQELGREEGELFLVMEYLEGESVSSLARRALVRGITLDPGLCAHIAAEACAGLHAAHELRDPDGHPQNLVHRDVSPQNVFVGYDGTVKILDFGIAKAADRITKTEAGILKGKFDYMSPEQCLGRGLDRRSDLFSMGIVLYEMTTGCRLFKRATQVATIRAVVDDPIPPPSELVAGYPPVLERVVLRALSRDLKGRHSTAADLRRDLLDAQRTMRTDSMPEQALSQLMTHLFADRVAEKRDMLRRVRDGESLSNVPVAEADVGVELPELDATHMRTVRRERPASRSRTGWIVGILGLAAAAVAIGYVVHQGQQPRAPAAAIEPAPAPEAAPPDDDVEASVERPSPALPPEEASGAPAGETVVFTVETTPDGATVVIDGEPRGRTPLEVDLPRGSEPLSLEIRRRGHETFRDEIVPDADQRLRTTLDRRRDGRATAPATMTPREEAPTMMGETERFPLWN